VSGDKVEVIEEEESSHNMEENIKKRFEGGWRDMGGCKVHGYGQY
jgi:hypothetical protein